MLPASAKAGAVAAIHPGSCWEVELAERWPGAEAQPAGFEQLPMDSVYGSDFEAGPALDSEPNYLKLRKGLPPHHMGLRQAVQPGIVKPGLRKKTPAAELYFAGLMQQEG